VRRGDDRPSQKYQQETNNSCRLRTHRCSLIHLSDLHFDGGAPLPSGPGLRPREFRFVHPGISESGPGAPRMVQNQAVRDLVLCPFAPPLAPGYCLISLAKWISNSQPGTNSQGRKFTMLDSWCPYKPRRHIARSRVTGDNREEGRVCLQYSRRSARRQHFLLQLLTSSLQALKKGQHRHSTRALSMCYRTFPAAWMGPCGRLQYFLP